MKNSGLNGDIFDVDSVTKSDMKQLADSIAEYLDIFQHVMVIPEDLEEEYGDKIKEGIKRTQKLVKKLYAGDKSVFKDADDVEPIW
jgi:hypothetical protein